MVEPDTPERLFAQNMKEMREHIGWSQNELASRMSTLGFRWYAATVYSVEKGERKIPLNEAAAIADLMNANVHTMTRPTREMRLRIAWDSHWESFRFAAHRLMEAAEAYESARSRLLEWVQAFKYQRKLPSGQINLLERTSRYSAVELIGPDMNKADKRLIRQLRSNREASRLKAGEEVNDGEHPEEA